MKHTVRLRERLLLVYLVGGLLPMLCMVLFLVGRQRAAVMDLSRSTSYSELSALRNLLAEDSRVLEDVSKRMYFDAQLETIARTQYTDYAQVVAAYRSCAILNEYEDYYSGTISSISIYLDNATFTGNSQLAQATEEVQQSKWYQQAVADQGRARWWYLENPSDGRNYLTLVRLIRTREGERVGLFHNRRILGYRRLSRLRFFCAALFLCKEQFCVSLCTKKLLHLFFRFAIVRVECFLFCQQFGVGGGHIFLYNPVQCGILNATTRKLTN